MKRKTLLASLFVVMTTFAFAQAPVNPTGYIFTDVKVNPSTTPKNQNRSSTCWSYSGLSMVKSDVIRKGKGSHDLSEMWIARNTYLDKAVKYVRLHGDGVMAGGGNFHDVFNVIKEHGIVPSEVYMGNRYGGVLPVHGEIDALLKAYVDVIVRNPNRTLSTVWQDGFNGILDSYFGPMPEKFTYQGKEYTPKSFAESLALVPEEYVSLTSFTHHPFYTQFALEIPDNWAWGLSYNVPMEEMIAIIDNAIENGYTVAWATDTSEKGNAFRKGLVVLPETEVENMEGSDRAKWEALSGKAREEKIAELTYPVVEKKVTQASRQEMFDNYLTTDDHGMEIVGVAKDQAGNKFYKVKNSYGTDQLYGGYYYASVPYVLAKTTNIALNKGGMPAALAAKLGIKK